ncbi:autoinducer binding domain-containing protein [Loktanella agnita]|uniref:autoinducer binding domain-containing protein n=1 Tax=Loktanella agnita TaxID=287097 RepID=UPI003985B6A4
MSDRQVEISKILGKLKELTPAGYVTGLQVNYTTPRFMFHTYSKKWLEYYSQHGFVMSDPTVAWCFENLGSCRWSELNDPDNVLDAAAEHNMRYGAVYSTDSGGSRSMAGFARNDREFTDQEIADMCELVEEMHKLTMKQSEIPPETVQRLKTMSIMVTHPG